MSPQRALPPLFLGACLGVLAAAAPAPAQIVTRVTPEAADTGDVVILTGPNLNAVTTVRFTANVGGFAGVWVVDVSPQTVTPTRVVALVPQMAGFAPPNATPPGNPVGDVRAISPLSPAAPTPVPFFFIQAIPTVSTEGSGTTQPGMGRPATGFTIAGGPPVPGNSAFTLTLENAVPGSIAEVFFGLPASPPFLPFGDGTIVIDLAQPLVSLPGFVVDGAGDVQVPLPLGGAPLNVTAMAQWLIVDPASGGFFVSNGLQTQL